MIQEQLFLNEWGVWFCFLAEPNEPNDKYYENYQLVFALRAPPDLAYAWAHFGLSSLDNFLLKPTGQQNSYLVKEKWRRINSVEYFKKGIEPKWEDPKNEKGGRFVFPVNRTQDNKDELYCNLVFYLLGEDFAHSEHINGFRFISPKNSQSFYRVEIWVDFSEADMELLKHFQALLTELFRALHFDSKSVRFLNNEQKEPSKDPK